MSCPATNPCQYRSESKDFRGNNHFNQTAAVAEAWEDFYGRAGQPSPYSTGPTVGWKKNG